MSNQTIHDVKEQCLETQTPIISDATASFLTNFVKDHQPKIVCEIGSAAGYSSAILASTLYPRGWKLYSFDISYPQYKKCIETRSKTSYDNRSCYHYDATQVCLKKFIYEEVDFAFIDAQKSHYLTFLENILPVMAPGAHIILDDCIKYHDKMTSLYLRCEKMQISYSLHHLDEDDGIMIIDL